MGAHNAAPNGSCRDRGAGACSPAPAPQPVVDFMLDPTNRTLAQMNRLRERPFGHEAVYRGPAQPHAMLHFLEPDKPPYGFPRLFTWGPGRHRLEWQFTLRSIIALRIDLATHRGGGRATLRHFQVPFRTGGTWFTLRKARLRLNHAPPVGNGKVRARSQQLKPDRFECDLPIQVTICRQISSCICEKQRYLIEHTSKFQLHRCVRCACQVPHCATESRDDRASLSGGFGRSLPSVA